MLANVHDGSGNSLRKGVYAIELYPTGKITDGYVEINTLADGSIKIYISKQWVDKVTIVKHTEEGKVIVK